MATSLGEGSAQWPRRPGFNPRSSHTKDSRVESKNPGNGVAPSPTSWCSSYRKRGLRVNPDYGHQLIWLWLGTHLWTVIPKKHEYIWSQLNPYHGNIITQNYIPCPHLLLFEVEESSVYHFILADAVKIPEEKKNKEVQKRIICNFITYKSYCCLDNK